MGMDAHGAAAAARDGIGVVILAKNERSHLAESLPLILQQEEYPPAEVLVVDSGSTDGTVELVRSAAAGDPRVTLLEIPPAEFHHAATRNRGAAAVAGRFVVFLGGDAVPLERHWLRELVGPVARGEAAACYGRQVPRPDADAANRCRMAYNYGPKSFRKHRDAALSTKNRYFFSSVNCCIDRRAVDEPLFDESFPVDEDATLSRRIIDAGLGIMYCADAAVRHSHNYGPGEMLRRSFDNAVVYKRLGIFANGDPSLTRDALRYLRQGLAEARRAGLGAQGRFLALFVCSGVGWRLGMAHQWLPVPLRRALSRFQTT